MLMHGRSLVHRYEAFGRWWTVSQCAVRPDRIVVATPFLDEDLGLTQAVEGLTIQKFVSEGLRRAARSGLEPIHWMVSLTPLIPGSLGQDHLVQRQIRNRTSEPGILGFQAPSAV